VFILSYENKLSFKSHAKVNLFAYEWVCTRPRFAEDAQDNSQIAVDAFVQEVIPQHAILMPWAIATELPSA